MGHFQTEKKKFKLGWGREAKGSSDPITRTSIHTDIPSLSEDLPDVANLFVGFNFCC